MLFKDFNRHEAKTALILEDGSVITYGLLQRRVDNIKAYLKGDKKFVVITGENNLATIASYIACQQSNHTVLLLNKDSTSQNNNIINHYKPNIHIKTSKNNWEVEILNDEPLDIHLELALLLPTSGSTGSPKLVKLSHQNLKSNTDAICEYLSVEESDRAITSLKPNYSYGLSIINTHLSRGASVILTNHPVSAEKFWATFLQYGATSFSGVPYSFELLAKNNVDFGQFPKLKYLTQAGGKLSPNLVKNFSQQADRYGFKFYVMYGQTEASPRISYLPPKFSLTYPESIGVAIPGGIIKLCNEDGGIHDLVNTPGELIYSGPNIMMGYAYSGAELATFNKLKWLHTGDLAIKNNDGIYTIIGRISRFIKPMGIRVSLDDLQTQLSSLGLIAAVSGNDNLITAAVENDSLGEGCKEDIKDHLAKFSGLPRSIFVIHSVVTLPTLPNGKLNYSAVIALNKNNQNQHKGFVRTFLSFFGEELLIQAGLKKANWLSIEDIFKHHFSKVPINAASSFTSLSGDSLSYVSISIALEQYIGHLPERWPELSAEALENEKNFSAI